MKEKCVYFKIDQIPKQNLKYKIMDILNIFEKKEDEQKIKKCVCGVYGAGYGVIIYGVRQNRLG